MATNEKETKKVVSEFTDRDGNPVEINNNPARELRSAEETARHEQRVSERPQRPARKEK